MTKLHRKAALGAAFFSLLVAACAPGPEVRREQALAIGQAAGFAEATVGAADFRLFGLLRRRGESDRLRIYIEGDGAPWIWPHQPPEDPTPAKSLVLGLAAADRSAGVAYLARPCQYLPGGRCEPRYWTTQRFAPEVVAAYQAALDELKRRTGASRLSLAGYSGGGVLAALLAEERVDVVELLTVAAPLDTAAWTRHHGLTPVSGDNPADRAGRLRSLPQHHWVGGQDEVVPEGVVRAFAERAGAAVSLVPGYDHECCWVDDWPRRLAEAGFDR